MKEEKIKSLNSVVQSVISTMSYANNLNQNLAEVSIDGFNNSKKSLKNIKNSLKFASKRLRKTKSYENLYQRVQDIMTFVDIFETEHFPDSFNDPNTDLLFLAARAFPNQLRLACGAVLIDLRNVLQVEKVRMDSEE